MKRSPIRRSKRKGTRTYQVKDGVRTYPDGREVCLLGTAAGDAEYDRRRHCMAVRQKHLCAICRYGLRSDGTFEHQAGRGMGGGHRDDRTEFPDGTWMNAAIHSECQRKGSIRYEWIDNNTKFVPVVRAEQLAEGE